MDMHAAEMCQTPQFTYLGRLTTVIAASLVDAMALAHEENFGEQFADVVRHTRELYNELLEELVIAGPSGDEFARGLADSIGRRLDGLEQQIAPVVAQIRAGPPPKQAPAGSPNKPPLPIKGGAELWHVWR